MPHTNRSVSTHALASEIDMYGGGEGLSDKEWQAIQGLETTLLVTNPALSATMLEQTLELNPDVQAKKIKAKTERKTFLGMSRRSVLITVVIVVVFVAALGMVEGGKAGSPAHHSTPPAATHSNGTPPVHLTVIPPAPAKPTVGTPGVKATTPIKVGGGGTVTKPTAGRSTTTAKGTATVAKSAVKSPAATAGPSNTTSINPNPNPNPNPAPAPTNGGGNTGETQVATGGGGGGGVVASGGGGSTSTATGGSASATTAGTTGAFQPAGPAQITTAPSDPTFTPGSGQCAGMPDGTADGGCIATGTVPSV